MNKISIVIPAYNEEKRIGKTLKEYNHYLQKLKKDRILDFEIVVVINCSTDRTLEIVRQFCKRNKEIKYLYLEKKGKGLAIIEGFKDSLKRNNDLIGFVDADMATPPEAYYDLIKNIKNNDGIIASRWINGSIVKTKQSFLRRVLSRGFNFIIRVLFFMPFIDTQCGAKLFKPFVLNKIISELSITQWAFDVNLLYLCKKNRFRIKEYPTIWEDKRDSKLDVTKVPIQMFLGVLRLRLINSPFEPLLRSLKIILFLAHKIINKT